MYTSYKLQRVPLKNNPPSPQHLHNKLAYKSLPAQDAIHYTESLHRRSATGWLKSSSPEFPQLASVIKVDEGRQLARRAQKWSSAWGSLCSVHGERLLCLVPSLNLHCLELVLGMLQLAPALLLLVARAECSRTFNSAAVRREFNHSTTVLPTHIIMSRVLKMLAFLGTIHDKTAVNTVQVQKNKNNKLPF